MLSRTCNTAAILCETIIGNAAQRASVVRHPEIKNPQLSPRVRGNLGELIT